MIAIEKNTTYFSCPICSEDYAKCEARDTKKVVEIVCAHFFHINCIESWNNHLEKTNRPLNCGYCNQIYAEPRNQNLHTFKNRDSFNSVLEDLKESYSYDSIATEALIQTSNIFEEIFKIQQDLDRIEIEITDQERMGFFIQDIKTLVVDHKEIKDELKGDVVCAIGAILSNDGCLRTLTGESRRWRGVPLDQFPEKVIKEGALVYIGGFKVRVSADYLHRSTSTVLIDDIVRKRNADAEYINAIPGNIVRTVYNFVTAAFGYFYK